jgi:hypothetical protein
MTIEDKTAGAVTAKIAKTERDLFFLLKTWDSAGRPYTAKEIALFESFSFEADLIDLFLKNLRGIGDPTINDFILLSVMHCDGKKTKEICEILYHSKKYQIKYLEILIWLLKRTTPITVKNFKMRMRIWFAIEICSAEDLIAYIEKNDPPKSIREKIICYSLPGQTWQMARDIWSNVDNDNPYGKVLSEVMEEFGCLL